MRVGLRSLRLRKSGPAMDIRNSLVQAICLLAIFETHRKLGNNDTNGGKLPAPMLIISIIPAVGKDASKECQQAIMCIKYALYATNEALYEKNDKYNRIPDQY